MFSPTNASNVAATTAVSRVPTAMSSPLGQGPLLEKPSDFISKKTKIMLDTSDLSLAVNYKIPT